MLQTATEAARRAGRLIAERYPDERNVTVKGQRDIVTEVDAAAETIILDLIRSRFPNHATLSEEAGGDETSGEYTWVVDPLDGTTNYAHRVPVFCVSIGVLKQGQPLLGVIHDPLRDQTFLAERGKGATLDGEALHVSRSSRLSHAILGLDWGHSEEEREKALRFLLQAAHRCGTVRALGSAALAQAYVAAGWLDAYLNPALKPWDVAAGTLLIAEAGGRCTTLAGDAYRLDTPGCLATNGILLDKLLTVTHLLQ